MTVQIKKQRRRNNFLKLVSLIIGATFWYIFGNMNTTTTWITAPLYFYNVPEHATIKAPESVSLKIMGKRSEIRMLDLEQVAIHINAQRLQVGPNKLVCDQETMFLPETIKLVHYLPSNPIIELCKAEDRQDV